MSLVCTECREDVKQGVSMVAASYGWGSVTEHRGYVICRSHVNDLNLKSLDNLAEGPILVFHEVDGKRGSTGNLQFSEPPEKNRLLGYLSSEEGRNYLPGTSKMIQGQVKA